MNEFTSLESVARRYASRPGCRFVGAQEVGIAVFVMDLRAIVVESKDIPPIDEFLLRSLNLGIHEPRGLASFLGLDERTVENRLVELRRAELIEVAAAGSTDDVRCQLTEKGRTCTDSLQRAELREITVPRLVFHGFLRKPLVMPVEQLLRPRELQERELPAIPPIPGRPPRPEEIKLTELARVIRQQWQARQKGKPPELVTVRSVLRNVKTMYQSAILIQYELLSKKKQNQVAFAVEGLLQDDYEIAFASCKGPERIPELLADKFKSTSDLAHEFLKPHIVKKLGQLSDVDELVEQLEAVQEQVKVKEVKLEIPDRPDTKQVLRDELERERAAKVELEKKLSQRRARRLRTDDCRYHLADSLGSAKENLVIVSAFISADVVNREFLNKLEAALMRGVNVWIIYGIGKHGKVQHRQGEREDSYNWKEAEKALKDLKKRYSGLFRLHYPGNTHEKILIRDIRDKDFVISGSFNWLSYRGVRGKSFRYEDAVLVTEPSVIEEYFNEITRRFQKQL